jgi:hypothetical protein
MRTTNLAGMALALSLAAALAGCGAEKSPTPTTTAPGPSPSEIAARQAEGENLAEVNAPMEAAAAEERAMQASEAAGAGGP